MTSLSAATWSPFGITGGKSTGVRQGQARRHGGFQRRAYHAREEARLLIEEIDSKLGSDHIRFYPGVSYRHLMVWKGGKDKIECTPPHDIQDKDIQDYLPRGRGR